MKQRWKKMSKKLLVSVLIMTLLPFTPLFSQQVHADDNDKTATSIAIPPGGFNSGNTSTTGNHDVRISGNAVLNGQGGVRLVANSGNQRGGVFFSEPIEQNSGFSASFQMRMGAASSQVADGFTFVLARDTNQVGAIGQGLGYSGIANSIAIEFDTFDNKSGGGNGTVPHIWYGTNGTMDTADNNRLVLFERAGGSFSGANASTGIGGSWTTAGQSQWRNQRNYTVHGWIEYDAQMTELQITYSSSPTRPEHPTFILRRGTSNLNGWINHGATYVAHDNNFNPELMLGVRYHVGFTAATGGSMQDTTLLAFSAFGEHTDPDEERTIKIGDREFEIGGGIDLPPINPEDIKRPPGIDDEATFQGLFDDEGTQYYDRDGNPVHVNDLEDGDELIPRFSSTIRLRNQGVADGVLSNVMNGAQLPATLAEGGVSIPIRDGFRFIGYYDDILTGSNQYYDEDGVRQVDTAWQPFDPDADGTGPAVLYAWWERLGSNVTVDLRMGGLWSRTPVGLQGSGDSYSSNGLLPGGTKINLPKPTRNGNAFTGWTISGADEQASLNGDVLTILGGGGTVTLTANWMGFWGDETAAVVYTVGGIRRVENDHPDLTAAFEQRNLADENEHGITAADLLQSGVRLIVNVNDIAKDSSTFKTAIEDITDMAKGNFSKAALDKLTFYEIYAEKIVTPRGVGDTVRTKLKSLPQPVTVRIPLDDELKGATGYTVFHRHAEIDRDGETVYRVADISDYGGNFYIDNNSDELVLQVKNFSEFAILPNGAHIHFHCEHWDYADDENFWGCPNCRFRLDGLSGRPNTSAHGTVVGNYEDFDVRARIVEMHSPLYRLDIEWGEMKFVFSLDFIWDYDIREYNEAEKNNDWVVTPDSNAFTQGNNRIRVYNRSNDGVYVSFTTKWKAPFLDDIDVEVKNENRADALPALNMPLARVPSRGGVPPMIEAFLRMQGNPDVEDFKAKYEAAVSAGRDWLHAATLTVTVEPMGNLDDLTP